MRLTYSAFHDSLARFSLLSHSLLPFLIARLRVMIAYLTGNIQIEVLHCVSLPDNLYMNTYIQRYNIIMVKLLVVIIIVVGGRRATKTTTTRHRSENIDRIGVSLNI